MPIIKSAIKRARQTVKRRSHNLAVKREVRLDAKALMIAMESGEAKNIAAKLQAVTSELDRAVKKGTLHKNTAARRKSRLAKLANQALSSDKPKTKTPAAGKKSAAKTTAKAGAKKTAAKKAPATKTATKTTKK
jgi:small subunit ribosomal protein S20